MTNALKERPQRPLNCRLSFFRLPKWWNGHKCLDYKTNLACSFMIVLSNGFMRSPFLKPTSAKLCRNKKKTTFRHVVDLCCYRREHTRYSPGRMDDVDGARGKNGQNYKFNIWRGFDPCRCKCWITDISYNSNTV